MGTGVGRDNESNQITWTQPIRLTVDEQPETSATDRRNSASASSSGRACMVDGKGKGQRISRIEDTVVESGALAREGHPRQTLEGTARPCRQSDTAKEIIS